MTMNFILKIRGKSKNILGRCLHIVLLLNLLSPCDGDGGGTEYSTSDTIHYAHNYYSPYYRSSQSTYFARNDIKTIVRAIFDMSAVDLCLLGFLILVVIVGCPAMCYLCSRQKYEQGSRRQEAVTRYLKELEEQRKQEHLRKTAIQI